MMLKIFYVKSRIIFISIWLINLSFGSTAVNNKVLGGSSLRQNTACKPDLFPGLTNPGFCLDLSNVDTCTTEFSAATVDCANFDGNFCCYPSLAEGNSVGETSTRTTTGLPVTSATPASTAISTNAPTPPTFAPSTMANTTPLTTVPVQVAAPSPTTTTSTTTSTSTTTTPTTTSTTTTTTASTTTTAQTGATIINVVTGTPDPNLLDTSKPEVQQLIVDLHNQVRRAQNAANMLKIQWDPVAASVAQDWANRCVNQHGPPVRNGSIFSGCGQNIAWGNGITSWNVSVQIWGPNEQKLFTFGLNPCPDTFFESVGHYTQLVWATTWQVGCGFAPCVGSTIGSFFVCNYCPAGNIGSRVCTPYLPGTPENGGVCGKCGGLGSSLCDNGLCTNSCSFTNQFSNCDSPDPNNPNTFPTLVPDTSACSSPNFPFTNTCSASCKCRSQGLIY